MQWYFSLFNAITDAVNALERITALLKQAQQESENLYIEG